MGDIENDLSFRPQLADDIEQDIDLVVAQAGSRLVKRDDIGIATDGLHDLYHLLMGDAQASHLCFRADIQPEAFGNFSGAPVHQSEIDQAVFLFRPVAQKDVLRHRHIHQNLTLLIDHAHAVRDRFPGSGEMDRLSVDQIFPKVRLVIAV